MQTLSQTVNGLWEVSATMRYFRIISADSPIDVQFFGRSGGIMSAALQVQGGFWIRTAESEAIAGIKITGSGVVKIAFAESGDGGYDAISIVGSVSTISKSAGAIAELPPVAVGTVAALIAAANPSRRQLRIYNAGSDVVCLGSSSVTADRAATRIAPGQLWIEDDAPAIGWYAVAASGSQVLQMQEVTA